MGVVVSACLRAAAVLRVDVLLGEWYRGVLRGAHHAASMNTEGIDDFAYRIGIEMPERCLLKKWR